MQDFVDERHRVLVGGAVLHAWHVWHGLGRLRWSPLILALLALWRLSFLGSGGRRKIHSKEKYQDR
jgi:hypothetical protein